MRGEVGSGTGKHTRTLRCHSLGVALGHHRPLPSADWWEPAPSTNEAQKSHKSPLYKPFRLESISLCKLSLVQEFSTVDNYSQAVICTGLF